MEKLEINLTLLRKRGLTPNEYVLLYLVSTKNVEDFDYFMTADSFKVDLEGLINDKVILTVNKSLKFNDLSVGKDYISLFTSKKTATKQDVSEWIDEYRDLFPKGIGTTGYPFRGSKASCLEKMVKFINQHDYEKTVILDATKEYVAIKRKENYQFMQLADNFIYKNNASTLASFCELISEEYKSINLENKLDF
jgi:hypothetical protein